MRFQHAHTRIAICIPKKLCGEPSPVSTQVAFATCYTRRYTVPLGFCCGGFSSTAGYVPGNEAQVRRHERRSTRSADHFRGALLVFIRVTGKVFRLFPQAFRLRPWRPSSGFPLLATLERCVTTSVPPPGAGQNARKQFRLCNGFYTR